MTQPPPKPDSSVDPTPSLSEAPTCSDSEWELSVELVPLDEVDSLVDVLLLEYPPPVKPLPPPTVVDWLSDLEPPTVQTAAPPHNEMPDWIADVAEIEASLQALSRSSLITPPDWLADIQQIESLRAPIRSTTLDSTSAPPTQLQVAQTPNPLPAVFPPDPTPTKGDLAGNTNPPAATEDPLLKKALAKTGCDPKTGQILDQQQYEKWNNLRVAEARVNPRAITTESIGEVYRNARNALARWVDDDNRRTLLLEVGVEELKKNPEIQAILDQYQNWGPVMREKLVHHLEYLLTNRKQYYLACLK